MASDTASRELFARAKLLRDAHPYRRGKRVMVADYEMYYLATGAVMVLSYAQHWEVEEHMLIARGLGKKVFAVKLTEDKEVSLP